jgi:hypothetical protein
MVMPRIGLKRAYLSAVFIIAGAVGVGAQTIPSAPILHSPANGVAGQSIVEELSWGSAASATSYEVQVSISSSFGTTFFDQTGTALSVVLQNLTLLSASTTYYWHAQAFDAAVSSGWSAMWSFTTVHYVFDTITDNNESVVLQTSVHPTFDGVPLGVYDEIGVFSNTGLCVGDGVWDSVGNGTSITVAGQNQFSSTTDGLQSGVDSMFFRVWHYSTRQEGRATVTFNTVLEPGDSVIYETDGVAFISSLSAVYTGIRLVIPLAKGWNMKSLNIHPADSTTGGVFSGLKGLYLVEDGKGELYWPGYDIDQIDTIRTGSGYQIYDTVSTDTIRLTGNPVAVAATPISLKALNWSIIGYLPQVNMPIAQALAGIASQVEITEDNEGNLYWPGYDIDQIDTMRVGEGYFIVTSAAATLTYPTGDEKRVAGGTALFSLPDPRHYAKHRVTGNDALFLARRIDFAGSVVSDNCEVGAFDSRGSLVGAGTVVNGLTAFAIWGKDPMTRAKDGCDPSEKITFRLWDGQKEYPLEVTGGGDPSYEAKKILIATLAVSAQTLISSFDLSRVYPNPFRGSVRIVFDVPAQRGTADQEVEIGIYDMKGCLVQSLVKGRYAAGSHAVSWNGAPGSSLVSGSNIYFVRMKANGFDKRLKLIELK